MYIYIYVCIYEYIEYLCINVSYTENYDIYIYAYIFKLYIMFLIQYGHVIVNIVFFGWR